jgi:hypothetical protein
MRGSKHPLPGVPYAIDQFASEIPETPLNGCGHIRVLQAIKVYVRPVCQHLPQLSSQSASVLGCIEVIIVFSTGVSSLQNADACTI